MKQVVGLTEAIQSALAQDDPLGVERALGVFENVMDARTGETVLSLAVDAGAVNVVDRLLASGVPPNAGGVELPLAAAVRMHRPEMVEVLLSRGAQADEPDAEGDSVLSLACSLRRWDLADQLLNAGAKELSPDGAVAAILGAPVDQARRIVSSALFARTDQHRGSEVLRALVLARGTNTDLTPERQQLMAEVEAACERLLPKHRRWVRLETLAKKGAKDELRAELERLERALQPAARSAAIVAAMVAGRWDVYQEFFPDGVDANAVASNGRTLLMVAAMRRRPQLCTTLLRMGARLDQRELEYPYESAREILEKCQLGAVIVAFEAESNDRRDTGST